MACIKNMYATFVCDPQVLWLEVHMLSTSCTVNGCSAHIPQPEDKTTKVFSSYFTDNLFIILYTNI